MTKIQTHGNCQCCGRDHAVLSSGKMSKHGYEVSEWHYFLGICTGEKYKPIQHEREIADSIVVSVRKDVVNQLAIAAKLLRGETFPLEARSGRRVRDEERAKAGKYPWVEEMVAFELAPAHHQEAAVAAAIYRHESQARHGKSFADGFEKLIAEKHGQPLREVKVDGPKTIEIGEKRRAMNGKVLTYYGRTHRGQVEYTYESTMGDGSVKKFRSHTTSPVWFKYPLAD